MIFPFDAIFVYRSQPSNPDLDLRKKDKPGNRRVSPLEQFAARSAESRRASGSSGGCTAYGKIPKKRGV